MSAIATGENVGSVLIQMFAAYFGLTFGWKFIKKLRKKKVKVCDNKTMR